ncbi:MAG: hypothetical protein OXJ55_19280 [Caldilineaceae bacterium]|nr:hypothetical protein [Caldilineaceae bacterium]MDE0464533.1 hypothetical protein [Caldilineaceae bacterium]
MRMMAVERVKTEREAEFGAARARLEAERERIREEISSYPAPIAGCDEQFNYLLERRQQVRRELARLVEEERLRRGAEHGESV